MDSFQIHVIEAKLLQVLLFVDTKSSQVWRRAKHLKEVSLMDLMAKQIL